MKLDENLVAIHAYLCGDGYVITSNKWKYYRVGLRNTNLTLLKDFQGKFEKVFGSRPTIRKEGRCEKCSKEIYELLTKKFGSFYSWKWKMPKLNKKLSKVWLRAYFDCEGWVFCKKHQNRHIGVDCVNEQGLNQVISSLKKLGIRTIKKHNKKRRIYRIIIYGKENIIKFSKEVGFLHPSKKEKLEEVLKDFVVYTWDFPNDKNKCIKFVKEILNTKIKIRRNKYFRMFSKEEENLKKLRNLLTKFYGVNSKVYRCVNGLGTVYYELNINNQEDIQKLINLKLVPDIIKNQIAKNV